MFRAIVSKGTLHKAVQKFAYYKDHAEEFAALKDDNNEKDAMAWFDPKKTKIMGRWSPTLVKLYQRV